MTTQREATQAQPLARRGRPRSERAHLAILRSASELLAEGGFAALSMDAIAARAGASKATIYRRWPNKSAVVMDAYLHDTGSEIAFPDTGSTVDDLRLQLSAVIRAMYASPAGRTIATLVAESQHDPTLARAFRERFLAVRRADATRALDRGRARGELRADLDTGVVIDLLYGALYYRLLVSGEPTGDGYADQLVDLVLPALRPRES
ncbi:MAG: TetR/AcrR family transcriptional regulator [Actinomycetes bacterium]